MQKRTSSAAITMLAVALSYLEEFGNLLATSLGRNKGNYTRPRRPRKFLAKTARHGAKSLDAQQYEKRYGSGFRYKLGSKPFSAQRQ